MVTPNTSGREELAAILSVAAQQDGPVRLFHPSNSKLQKRNPGLFPSSRGSNGELIKELLGTMLEEVFPRPRMVKLTEFGLETLVRNTPQKDRRDLISKSSKLYRDDLLTAWAKFATRGEEVLLAKSIREHHGQWFPEAKDASNLEEFREFLAQEIADSWKSAESEESRKRLGHLLKVVGAEPLGKKGETVEFSGMRHTPVEPLFPGDPAQISREGWIFPKSPTPILLAKAEVTPTTN